MPDSKTSPSLDLLLALVRGDRSPVVDDIDSSDLYALARAHRLLPFVARVAPPEVVSEQLRTESRQLAMRGLAMAGRLRQIVDAFEGARVRVVPLKGPVLAMQAFGELGARSFIDLDVLVHPNDGRRACELLSTLGFTPHVETPAWIRFAQLRDYGECSWRHRDWNVALDLHSSLLSPGYSFTPPPELVFSRLTSIELAGRAMTTLDRELTFAYQCAHSAKHNWAALAYVVELAALVQREPLDVTRLETLIGRVGTRRMLGVGLLLVSQVAGVTLPPGLAQIANATIDAGAVRAVEQAASRWREPRPNWLHQENRVSLRHPIQSHVFLQTLGTPLDVARFVARTVVKPNLPDWTAIDLPPSLHALYVPLRVARLARRELATLAAGQPHWKRRVRVLRTALVDRNARKALARRAFTWEPAARESRTRLIEAFALLTVARVAVAALPFRVVARTLGASGERSTSTLSPADQAHAADVARAVERAATWTPFAAVCLPQAITAKWMLRRRGVSTTLSLGVRRQDGGSIEAHAWLRAGEEIVTGGANERTFRELATFS